MKRSELIKIIFQREYMKTIRKPSFWAATLLLPILFGGLMAISAISSQDLQDQRDLSSLEDEQIAIVDKAGVIKRDLLPEQVKVFESEDAAIQSVKNEDRTAAFIYPQAVLRDRTVEVYVQSDNLLSRGRFDPIGRALLSQSVIADLENPGKAAVISGDVETETTAYQGTQPAPGLSNFIIPGLLAIGLLVLVMLSANYIVQAVSEEKENRLVEIVNTVVEPKTFLGGKMLGLTILAFTQLAVIGGFIALAGVMFSDSLPVDIPFGQVEVIPSQLALGIFYLIIGYLILTAILVAVSALMPNTQEASKFSGTFIFLSISPLFFLNALLTAPSGTVAHITSYIPFTAAPILLVRNALNALPAWEAALSVVVLIAYFIILSALAVTLYKIGGTEYANKLNPKDLWVRFRSR